MAESDSLYHAVGEEREPQTQTGKCSGSIRKWAVENPAKASAIFFTLVAGVGVGVYQEVTGVDALSVMIHAQGGGGLPFTGYSAQMVSSTVFSAAAGLAGGVVTAGGLKLFGMLPENVQGRIRAGQGCVTLNCFNNDEDRAAAQSSL